MPRDREYRIGASLDRIGHYEVVGLLGEGGMGVVYRGRDPRFDRDVAIKVLHEQFRRDPGVVERFKSEAVIQAKLNHPHIVTVLDFVAVDRYLAIVMEHVDGQPLDGLLAEAGGALEAERAVRLIAPVLLAMGFAHRRGLVHRDLKPSNILVQRLDDVEFAKVTDFGIAKILGAEKLRTATGAKMGTLAYMSPEHVRSPKQVDARSDVYSLGVVLFEMLTGRVPFDAESEYDLMRQIVEQPPGAEARALLPPSLAPAVERALEKDPSRRPQSCEELRAILGQSATRPTPSERPIPAPAKPAPAVQATRAATVVARAPALRRSERPPGSVKEFPDGPYVWVPAGTFMMGCAPEDPDADRNERPQHLVTMARGFWLARSPTTLGQYRRVGMPQRAPQFSQSAEHPIVGITWHEASDYCRSIGARLPTDAEWERAARGGREGLRYPLGNTIGHEDACFESTGTAAVGSTGGNDWGLTDLAGNVWEWCRDSRRKYGRAAVTNPDGGQGMDRVLRGGSWSSHPRDLRCSVRLAVQPGVALPTFGFRCARDE